MSSISGAVQAALLCLVALVQPAAASATYELLHEGAECQSPDEYLGSFSSVTQCADACAATDGCSFFIYGTDQKSGSCWVEFTTSAACAEGWEIDYYNFYGLTRAPPNPPFPPPPPPSPPTNPITPSSYYQLVRTGAECTSNDAMLGTDMTLSDCAQKCIDTPGCLFFIYGTGFKAGRCYWEYTATEACSEGFEVDNYDFYRIACENEAVDCRKGCTEPRASNFDSTAAADDGSCISDPACAVAPLSNPTRCTTCSEDKKTGTCVNGPYRSYKYDEVKASRVPDDAIVIDGDLRDWRDHVNAARNHGDRCYVDVPFAREDDVDHTPGAEIVFETHAGGKYFGKSDFSARWMLAWDTTYFYLAAEVTDDVLQTSDQCFKNGMQVAFEVGGPGKGEGKGMLQAERSADLAESRLELINLSLGGGQSACTTTGTDAGMCCVDYELSQQDGGFYRRAKVAILRNPMTRTTTYETAFHKSDLFGNNEAFARRWKEGLTFGFSFVINDGDDAAEQNGWGGYYPYAIVKAWYGSHQGQKQPQKAGTVVLASADAPVMGGAGGDDGDAGKSFGFFLLGVVITVLVATGYSYVRANGVGAVGAAFAGARPARSRTSPMATHDASTFSSFTPPPLVVGGMAPTSSTM